MTDTVTEPIPSNPSNPLPTNTLQDLELKVAALTGSVEALRAKRSDIQKQINALQELYRELRDQQYNEEEELANAKRSLAVERERKAREPDFDDPAVKAALALLQELPAYKQLRNFQKEDLAVLIDNFIRPRRITGFINANDMGLGKTAETAMLLQVIAKLRSNSSQAT